MKIKKLKLRRVISGVLVVLVALLAFFKLTAQKTEAAWFDDSWAYRQATKKSALADLVRLTSLRIDWPDNLSGKILQKLFFVKYECGPAGS